MMFTAQGTAAQIASVLASLDALAGPKQPGETRNLDQRRFDAFMDLTCGRAQPGNWQALIVVPLATLEGGDDPAEVPGLGLVCAEEARDVLATAELRRAVVADDGTLVSVDGRVHRPDLSEVAEAERHPDSRLSLEVEPEALDLTPEHTPAGEDLAWLDQTLEDAAVEVVVVAALSTLEHDLAEMLTLVPARTGTRGWEVVPRRIEAEVSGRRHGGGSDGSWGGDPPESGPPPEPEPPSFDDLDWHEHHQDRAGQDAQEPKPVYQREPDSPDTPEPPRGSAWSMLALTKADRKLRTTPADPPPGPSASYVLPVPMARFIKHRDIVCTFPGCRRLARDCHSDHLDPWPIGPTTVHNTSSECVHHHQAKHAYFTVTRNPTGALTWTTPRGRSYTRNPRPLLRGW